MSKTDPRTQPAHQRFNCLCPGDTLDQFSAFYVAPCRNDRSEAERLNGDAESTCIVQCEPGEAEFYSIYGSVVSDRGCEWLAVHDETTPDEIVRIARQINAETGKPFFWRDERYGCLPSYGARLDFVDIAEALTEEIADEIPDLLRDPDARDDDFDNHSLADIREAFVTYSAYSEAEGRDPYLPVDDAA